MITGFAAACRSHLLRVHSNTPGIIRACRACAFLFVRTARHRKHNQAERFEIHHRTQQFWRIVSCQNPFQAMILTFCDGK
jgi:hypothetical protein